MKRIVIGLGVSSVCLFAAMAASAGERFELDWRKDSYEPATPKLDFPLMGVKTTVSGQWNDRGPQFITDGVIDSNDHWACETLPAVATFELQKVERLACARVWFYFNEPRVYKFHVEASADNVSWKRVADWSGNEKPSTAEGFIVPFAEAVDARFLRLTVTDGSNRGAGAHVVEFQAYASEVRPGLHGRNVPTERIHAGNAAGDESFRTWRAVAWRNERVHGQFVVWSEDEVKQLRVSCTDLKSADGSVIPRAAVQTRFVRHVLADKKLVGDVLDTADSVDLPMNGFRSVWLTVAVPPDVPKGLYHGTLAVKGTKGRMLEFPLELEVLGATLPAPKDWAFFLDLWQHPWAISRYHGVKPFSAEHYALMEPVYRELANAGQKVLTTTITELPWNHQNFDAYHTMIPRVKHADGSWTFDYAVFDEYVAFGRKCGIGPQIHCYTMVPWGDRVYYTEAETGDRVAFSARPGTPEHEAYWGPFLKDFERHLVEKGWIGDTYIAMDERAPEDIKATADCVRKYSPRLKVAMPGNHPPSHFKGIEIHNYSQLVSHVDRAFLNEINDRRAQGKTTTCYVCCVPVKPNSFTFSPTSEQVWLGYYVAASGFDGLLRWAFVNWPRDPLYDSGFGPWPAGDTFLLYPGPRSSIRWEMLRDGIEEAEKIRLLRAKSAVRQELKDVLAGFEIQAAEKSDAAAMDGQVARARKAVEASARTLD